LNARPPLRGKDAIDFLANEATAGSEASASAHWREMHRDFRYQDGAFQGLRGFGGHAPAPGWIRRSAHRWLQRPYRRLGRSLARFDDADRAAEQIVRMQDRTYDLDALRQALTAALLLEKAPARLAPGATAAIIGDGFGMLGALLLTLAPGVRIISVNLTRTLLVDLVYLARALPALKFALATDAASLATLLADQEVRVIALRAEDAPLLAACPLDLAANVVSMQEMDPPVIAGYFKALRAGEGSPVAFYCCNREEKTLPDGTVVRFLDYPWSAKDDILLDEACPWSQTFYTWRPPLYRRYDGPIWHRLALLEKVRGA
jgi:putative sugar O-methyltransferase